QLIKGGSEERRKFFDSLLSQVDKTYLEQLIRYQHFLKQRNALIKRFSESNRVDAALLEPYDKELIHLCLWISGKRSKFIQAYAPLLLNHYLEISGSKEQVHISYESNCLDPSFKEAFKSSLKKDLL